MTEWLGNEPYAYIPFEAPPEVQDQLTELERELDGESLRTQLVVSLDAASRIREGEEAELFVDARKMHLFDPAHRREPHRRPLTRPSFHVDPGLARSTRVLCAWLTRVLRVVDPGLARG